MSRETLDAGVVDGLGGGGTVVLVPFVALGTVIQATWQ